jgi:hypothetical protein
MRRVGRLSRLLDELELGADVDRPREASRHRAGAGMNVVDPFGVVPSLCGHPKPVVDPDPLYHQNAVLGLDLPGRFDLVALRIDLDLTRLQRARKRAGQSATGRRDDVVKRRRVRRVLRRVDAVVLGHLGVNPECDRILLGRKVRQALRPAQPLDPDPRDVGDLSHRLDTTPSSRLDCAPGRASTARSPRATLQP